MNFGGHGVRRRDPVQGSLDLAAVRRIPPSGFGIVRAAEFDDLAGGILDHVRAGDEIGVAKPHLPAGRQPEELPGRILHEISALDEDFPAEGHGAGAGLRVFRVVDRLQDFPLALRVVLDNHLEGIEHAHPPRRTLVELVADAMFEHGHVNQVVRLGHADAPDEVPDRLRGDAAPPHAAQRGHTGVVPSPDVALPDQPDQGTFRHDRIGQVEAGKLVLLGHVRHRQAVDQPIVEGR